MSAAIESTKGDIAAVVASNDGTAGGAIQALEGTQAGRKGSRFGPRRRSSGHHPNSGWHSDHDHLQTAWFTSKLWPRKQQWHGQKERPSRQPLAISIGDKTIPATLLVPVIVTKDNVKQTVIKDGFQNLETIQKSLPKEKWPK